MPPTAFKLGRSPLTLDWSALLQQSIPLESALASDLWLKLSACAQSGASTFFDLPETPTHSRWSECETLAQELLKSGFTDCIWLGIGGSSLGPISLLQGLAHRVPRAPDTVPLRMHFLESPDPASLKLTLEVCDPSSTLVVAVTKSGGTYETQALLMRVLQWLGRDRWKAQVVALTDPISGELRTWVRAEGLRSLEIPSTIGGRFSVLSPVGLFAAALMRLNGESLLVGAREVRAATLQQRDRGDVERSPLLLLAQFFVRSAKSHPVHVCMPYTDRLASFAQWWVQLWGESLGKGGFGLSPLAACGPKDQHSLLQLLSDGPNDKIICFITVDDWELEKFGDGPSPFGDVARATRIPVQQLLMNTRLGDLLLLEAQATAGALRSKGRPHWWIRLDRLDERALGGLYFFFETLTALTGFCAGVNPFDQPGVEETKKNIQNALVPTHGETQTS